MLTQRNGESMCHVMKVKPQSRIQTDDWNTAHKNNEKLKRETMRQMASKDKIFPQNLTVISMAESIHQRNSPMACYLSSYNLKFGFVCFLPPLHTQKPQRSIQSKQRPHENTLMTPNVIMDFNVHLLSCKPTAGALGVYQCSNISSRKSLSKA